MSYVFMTTRGYALWFIHWQRSQVDEETYFKQDQLRMISSLPRFQIWSYPKYQSMQMGTNKLSDN